MKNKIISLVSIIILIIILISLAYLYTKTPRIAKEDTAAVIAKLATLMELPKNEEPSLVTVVDIKKLKGQVFFANAKNGDRVIMYAKSNKAIVFRPATNKIIEVAPIQTSSNQSVIKIGILNGAPDATDSAFLEKELMSKINNIIITEKRDAIKTYEKMLVIDIQGTRTDVVKQLAQFMGGEVSKLPKEEILTNEEKKNMDVLIIMGSKQF